jgi:cell division protein FtsN
MRTSPVILVSCGIIFASLIFLLDLRAQTETRAGQETGVSRTVSNSPAKNQTVPANMRQETVQTNVPAATPLPSATPAPTPAASTVPASQNNDEELARQQSEIAPGQPASDVKASTDEASRAESSSADEGNYTLQVGSFNDLAEASERVAKLGSLGITAYVARVEIPKRGTWYRVQTGSFRSREEAARYGTQLRSSGSVADFIITERRAS